jgi:hypothetical protein
VPASLRSDRAYFDAGNTYHDHTGITYHHHRNSQRILKSYFDYYLGSRTHLSLAKDAPTARVVQGPEAGQIVEIPQVGGLHHRYERRAA